MSSDAPLFEVTLPIENPADRRLTTAEAVRTLIGSPAGDDAKLETFIDTVTADCVTYCGLARARGAAIPTFGFEELRATWLTSWRRRGPELRLPWRTPVVEIASVVEGGITLTEDTDFRQTDNGVLERISGDSRVCWADAKIVVEYGAGWDLPDGPPADLVARVTDQVKMLYLGRANNPGLRSHSTDGVGSETFSVIGGDSIGESGLLKSVESALTPFRSWAVA